MKVWGDSELLKLTGGADLNLRLKSKWRWQFVFGFNAPEISWTLLMRFWLRMTKINWSSETSVIWDDGSLVRSASLASWLSLKSLESTYFHIMSTISKPGLTNTPVELHLRSQAYLKYCYKLCSVWGNAHSICCFFYQIGPVTLFSSGRVIYCLPDVH